jgi:hypothetical protein
VAACWPYCVGMSALTQPANLCHVDVVHIQALGHHGAAYRHATHPRCRSARPGSSWCRSHSSHTPLLRCWLWTEVLQCGPNLQ